MVVEEGNERKILQLEEKQRCVSKKCHREEQAKVYEVIVNLEVV